MSKKRAPNKRDPSETGVRLPSFNDFSPSILGDDIRNCLAEIVAHGGNDRAVYAEWAKLYFNNIPNKRSSTNIPATLTSTGLIIGTRPMTLSAAGKSVLAAASKLEAAQTFCAHILRERNGKLLLEALSALHKRKERVTKSSLKQALVALGVGGLSRNTTDHTTLKNWFVVAGLVDKSGKPIDHAVKSTLGISSEEIDQFKGLSLGQQVFLHLLRKRHGTASGPFQVKDLLGSCIESHPHLIDEAQFAKKIRAPLIQAGWITVEGLPTGPHGGRSGRVLGTQKLLDIPLSELIPDFDQVVPSDLRAKLTTPLTSISADLFSVDKNKAGIALELLALRMIMDLGLEPRSFRLRSAATAHAEVDLIAEGTHLMFSRWTFQCKRYSRDAGASVSLGDVAKEVGIAIYAKAHVVVMVTTSQFTSDAAAYAAEISRATHLQFVFVDGVTVAEYLKKGGDALRSYFLANAKDVMAAKRQQQLPAS